MGTQALNKRSLFLRNKFKTFALDTNIFIYHFHRYPKFTELADNLFLYFEKQKRRTVTSIISLVELLSYKVGDEKIKELKEAFNTTPNLTIYAVEDDIADRAAQIRRKYNFRLPDSIQLATALHSKAQAFITNDRRLKRFKELPVLLLSETKL